MCTGAKKATEKKEGSESDPWVKSMSVGMHVRLGNAGLTKYRGNGDRCAVRERQVGKREWFDFLDGGFPNGVLSHPWLGGRRLAKACCGPPLWQSF